jgi:hypothetical protein
MNMSVEAFENRARVKREIPDEGAPLVMPAGAGAPKEGAGAPKKRGRPKAATATAAGTAVGTDGGAADAVNWREKYEQLLVRFEVLRLEAAHLRKVAAAGGQGKRAASPIAAALAEARAMRPARAPGSAGNTETKPAAPAPRVIFPAP